MQKSRFNGIPAWSAIAIVLAALVTGLLLSLGAQEVTTPFLICYAVATLAVTLFVEARGLFLTVASIPPLFAVMTVISSWLVGRSLANAGTDPFSTTSVIAAIYPITQFFPWLAVVTVLSIVIAVVRIWLLRRADAQRQEQAVKSRRHHTEADRRNRTTAVRARRQSTQVTVEELIARNKAHRESNLYSRKDAQGPQ